MPSVYAMYNQEVLEGHREALAVLRELLKEEKNPHERRKLANAILRTKPAKDPEAEQPKAPPVPSQRRAKAQRETNPEHRNDDDLDKFDDEDDLDREAAALARGIAASPDPLAALERLRSLILSSMNGALPPHDASAPERP